MKKVVTLVLVLGLVSVANAALVFSVGGVEITTLDGTQSVLPGALTLHVSGIDNYTIEISTTTAVQDHTGTEFSSMTVGNSYVGTPTADWSRLSGSNMFGGDLDTDVFWGLDLSGIGVVTITDLGEAGAYSGSFEIPEPATMALLGLGGLLLRRKRK